MNQAENDSAKMAFCFGIAKYYSENLTLLHFAQSFFVFST